MRRSGVQIPSSAPIRIQAPQGFEALLFLLCPAVRGGVSFLIVFGLNEGLSSLVIASIVVVVSLLTKPLPAVEREL